MSIADEVTTIGAPFIAINIYKDCEGKCFWRGPTKANVNHVWEEISEQLYHELGRYEIARLKAARPDIPDSACTFGKCDCENACTKLGMCRYEHHDQFKRRMKKG